MGRLSALFVAIALCVTAFGAAPARADVFSMAPFKTQCKEDTRIYASCLDQRKILSEGLAAAKAQGKLAVVILGFNDCPPCNVLDKWMATPAAQALLAPYQVVEISIFDPERNLRPEVFSDIIPSLKLPINTSPPYGVPHFAIVDPTVRQVVGMGIIGFDANDQSKQIAYLTAHSKH